MVTGFCGIVTATIKSASIDLNLDLTPTAPGTDIVMATILACDGDAVGTSYTLNTTFGGILVATTPGGIVDAGWDNFLAPVGDITFDGVGEEDGGGAIQWCISYIALAPGARIEAATTD